MINKEEMLRYHLQYNHYPPVHPSFIPVAQEAIDKANNGEWEFEILMPNGITKSAGEIVEGLHLECFLDQVEEFLNPNE
jgi:hypothetical protein